MYVYHFPTNSVLEKEIMPHVPTDMESICSWQEYQCYPFAVSSHFSHVLESLNVLIESFTK